AVLAILLAATGVLSLFLGSRPNGIADVLAVLVGAGDPHLADVVDSRIPRTVMGATVGAALAVSGTLIQGITRNPLGEPRILGTGVAAPAGLVPATAALGAWGAPGTLVFALLGPTLAVSIVWSLGGRSGARSFVPLTLAVPWCRRCYTPIF